VISCTEVLERPPIRNGDDGAPVFLLPVCCSVLLQFRWAYVNQPKVFVVSEVYHMVVSTKIFVNKMTSELKGNTDMYMDSINTLHFFLFASTSENIDISIFDTK
jgi:hypothetical protein